MHDSLTDQHNPQCLEGTRTEVLREIIEWVQDPSSKAVYWLNGMAGTGKSTISRTIANRLSQQDDFNSRLGATFFFKRGEGDRDKMSKFFATVTSQLAQHSPEIAEHVQGALDADPSLLSKTMRTQFEKLIVDPVSKISIDSSRTFLFVIDALDECEREEDVRFLIKLLSGVPRLPAMPLKFFLTSRPELPIRLGFNDINGTYQNFVLHRVKETVIAHDLTVYFKYRLRSIRKEYNDIASLQRRLPENWPSEIDLGTLVKMAIPLFIFATTICRFIGDGRIGPPDEQMREVWYR
ncbi:hypothetical protein KJ359_001716 [Pestalotiopsis sp. 9143b]|nr:hypothetical protein KJ359_001716 [Pestalotiopsis sp. 9143b]